MSDIFDMLKDSFEPKTERRIGVKKTYLSKRGFECYCCLTAQPNGSEYVRHYHPKDREGKRYSSRVCLSCTDLN